MGCHEQIEYVSGVILPLPFWLKIILSWELDAEVGIRGRLILS